MTPEIRIGEHVVGRAAPCYVIAEAGVNHDGDVEKAIRLVREAQAAGADAVKFQLFHGDDLASDDAPKAGYQIAVTDPAESQLSMLKALELPDDTFGLLADEARRVGIDFLCTAYSEHGIEVLERIGVPAFKLASAQIIELPLIARIAEVGRPLLISTGMATLDEIDAALETVRRFGNPPVVLLQCTADYPSLTEEANLRVIPALAERYHIPVGYSDHTLGKIAAVCAVALGAVVLEKHLTLDRMASGPDHRSSLEPGSFANLLRAVREVEAALGRSEKEPTARERGNIFAMRRSLFAAETIPAGTLIERRHVALRRPASGLPPSALDQVVGSRATVEIPAGTPLRREHVEP
jgi:N,N'-diacetyllegionaminate synthase